jgi:hypothetical protein
MKPKPDKSNRNKEIIVTIYWLSRTREPIWGLLVEWEIEIESTA